MANACKWCGKPVRGHGVCSERCKAEMRAEADRTRARDAASAQARREYREGLERGLAEGDPVAWILSIFHWAVAAVVLFGLVYVAAAVFGG